MNKFLFLFILFFSHSAFSECDNAELVKSNFSALEILSNQLDKVISIDMTNNIPQFCQVNGFRDQKDSFGFSLDVDSDAGWQNSFIATKDYREASFLMHFAKSGEKKRINDIKKEDIDKLYEVASQSIQSYSDQLETGDKELLAKSVDALLTAKADQQEDLDVSLLQSSFLCKDLTLLNIFSCGKGVKKLIGIARPVNGTTLLPLWKKVAEDPNYMKVFKEVSVKIVSNLKNGIVPATRFIDDLQTAFFSLTKNKAEAEDYAWNTMALISAGGGNADIRPEFIMEKKLNDKNLSDFLWVLSNGAMALDRVSAEKGFLYTYPKEVNNLCDYGKNYHFWMTAYLARELNKENKNALASAAAAYTVEKGYQFAKQGEGRDPRRPFTEALYSNYSNNIRLDLSLAAAGAWYGVKDNEKELSRNQVEEAMKKTFRNSKGIESSTAPSSFVATNPLEMVQLYSSWKKIINPDEAFEFFKSETGH